MEYCVLSTHGVWSRGVAVICSDSIGEGQVGFKLRARMDEERTVLELWKILPEKYCRTPLHFPASLSFSLLLVPFIDLPYKYGTVFLILPSCKVQWVSVRIHYHYNSILWAFPRVKHLWGRGILTKLSVGCP
jgi:hypothetical protein